MTARERLYTALDGRLSDRPPVVPKIWVDLAARLCGIGIVDLLGEPSRVLSSLIAAARLAHADAVRLFHFPARRVREDRGRVFEVSREGDVLGEIDMQGGLATHLVEGSRVDLRDPYFIAYHNHWIASGSFVRDIGDAASIVVPDRSFYDELGWGERLEAARAELDDELTEIGDCSAATMAFYVSMRGMNRAMIDLIEEPALVHRTIEKGVAIAVEKGKFNIDHGVEVLRVNDSVGNMSVISPSHWREFVFPHMKRFCDEIHDYSPRARVYCHICGDVLPIVEDLVRTGLDCIGPLDPLGGFSPADVRSRVGDSVSLMGGVNTLSFVTGTPEEVESEARRCIADADPSQGYILGSGCVVPRDAKLENLRALRRASEAASHA